MFRTLFLMLVLLAGLIAGPYLSGKQGYVLIETGSYSIEMSITTLSDLLCDCVGNDLRN